MKTILLLCILLVVVDYSVQVPKYVNCDRQVLSGDSVNSCVKVTCEGSQIKEILHCDAVTCGKKKQIGYHEGKSYEEFPGCCSYPICK